MFRSLSRSTGKKATGGDPESAPEKLGSAPSSSNNSSSGSLAVPSSSSGSLAVPDSSPSSSLAGGGATMKRNVSISKATSKDVLLASASGNLTVKSLPPIPAQEELDQMFMEVVERMNVQEGDKARMMSFPAEKKWQLVLDSDHAKSTQNTNPPKHYLELLEHHLKKRKKKKNSQSAKEQAATEKDIQGMEISLRTNPLSWINEFIDPPNNGYDLLSEFLDHIPEEPEFDKERYLSLLCVKAVMNNKYGLNYVLKRAGSIQQLVNMLFLTQEKANILLYHILSAVCVVGGAEGHALVLQALDNYAKSHEKIRYQTLVVRLGDERFNFDYKASLMAFITVLVHFPESIHHRIYLQYEFTMLGMDGLIDTLLSANSEVLDVQLHGYLSNFVSIPENYQSGSLPVAKKAHGAGASSEGAAPDPIDLAEFRQEKANLQSQVISLQKELQEKEQAAANRISELQKQLGAMQGGQPLDAAGVAGGASVQSLGAGTSNATPEASVADSAPAPTAGAPPPPPPPAPGAPPPPGPPPPPGMGGPAAGNGLPPKRKIQPKVPLPTLNWMPIKDPSSTVFKDIDDENFHKSYDFTVFEQKFKKNVRETKDAPATSATMEKKKPAKEEIQVVDANRSRNVLLAIKKIDMKNEDLGKAIQNLNTSLLSGDRAEILLRCIPTPEEVTSLQAYDARPEKLSEGDRFLLFFSKIERAETKLKIMAFMESFEEDVNALQPQLNTVIAAAGSLRASVKLKKIFEVILAFGNYMNSAKRGGAYGFKLSALERLSDVKSNDSHSLLFFLADLISKDFPAYNAFTSDLLSLEAASMVSLQTTTSELNELVAGLKVLEGEMKYLKGNKQVEDFFAKATTKIASLQADFANMTDMYQKTAAYFGEDPKTTETTEFFSHFLRFVKNYQAALKEIELLAKQAEKPKAAPGKRVRGSYVEVEKGAVDDVINEIRLKGFRR